MTIINVFILSIVEGLSEFLPISSTGHLLIASKLLAIDQTNFVSSFTITIQLGAILAVVFLYGRNLFLNKSLLLKVSTAFVPTAVIGFGLYKIIKHLLMNGLVTVGVTLIVGGLILMAFEYWYEEKDSDIGEVDQITYKQAFLLGLAQSVAMIPGVSRSGATIVGGMLLRLKRKTIVEFSFLLAIPTMIAATGYDLLKSASTFSFDQWELMTVGMLASFLVSLLAVKGFLRFVAHYQFTVFGVYRVIVGLLVLWFLI